MHAWPPQVGVDHEHAPLELLRHGERQVQRRHRLAVVLARARDLNHAHGLTALRARDTAAQRTVLFGRRRERIERCHEHGTQRRFDRDARGPSTAIAALDVGGRGSRRPHDSKSCDVVDVGCRIGWRAARGPNARLEQCRRRVADLGALRRRLVERADAARRPVSFGLRENLLNPTHLCLLSYVSAPQCAEFPRAPAARTRSAARARHRRTDPDTRGRTTRTPASSTPMRPASSSTRGTSGELGCDGRNAG